MASITFSLRGGLYWAEVGQNDITQTQYRPFAYAKLNISYKYFPNINQPSASIMDPGLSGLLTLLLLGNTKIVYNLTSRVRAGGELDVDVVIRHLEGVRIPGMLSWTCFLILLIGTSMLLFSPFGVHLCHFDKVSGRSLSLIGQIVPSTRVHRTPVAHQALLIRSDGDIRTSLTLLGFV